MIDLLSIETLKVIGPTIVFTIIVGYALIYTVYGSNKTILYENSKKVKLKKRVFIAVVGLIAAVLNSVRLDSDIYSLQTINNFFLAWGFAVFFYKHGAKTLLNKAEKMFSNISSKLNDE